VTRTTVGRDGPIHRDAMTRRAPRSLRLKLYDGKKLRDRVSQGDLGLGPRRSSGWHTLTGETAHAGSGGRTDHAGALQEQCARHTGDQPRAGESAWVSWAPSRVRSTGRA